jgi:hypothetical protein
MYNMVMSPAGLRKNAGETSRNLPDRPTTFPHNLLFMVWRRSLTPSPQSIEPGLHIYIPQRWIRPTLLPSIGVRFHSAITTHRYTVGLFFSALTRSPGVAVKKKKT